MRLQSKLWLNRDNTTFKSILSDVLAQEGIDIYSDRLENQTNWIEVKVGDKIYAQSVRDWITKINTEITKRNEAYRNNPNFVENNTIITNSILSGSTILVEPFQMVQSVFEKYLGDAVPKNSIPLEIQNLTSPDKKVLVLSYRNKFARLEFDTQSITQSGQNFIIKYEQSFNYFGDTRGLSSLNTTYDDLAELVKLREKKPSKKINVGILENGYLSWFNNIRLENLSISETRNPSETLLNTRPTDWTDVIGKDENSVIGGNLKHAKSRKDVLEKDYADTIGWQFNTRSYDITVELTYDADLEEFVSQNLTDAIVLAQDFNKFKQYTNTLTASCLCNCNYCTCDCNYCTCDCNYCTCNCNYCTCNCNYCTCNCNYKYVDPNDTNTLVSTVNYYTRTLCACDTDKQQYYTFGYGDTYWPTHLVSGCPANRSNYKYCSCNTNAGQTTLRDKTLSIATISTSCSCNSNTKSRNFVTPYFANSSDDTEFTNQTEKEIPSMAPSFSKDETYGDIVNSIGKSTKSYTVCVCDINTKVYSQSTFYKDESAIFYCSCNTNKNVDGSSRVEYKFNDASYGTSPNYTYPSNPGQSKVFNFLACPANRDLETRIDYKQFWEDTANSAGKETK